MVEIPESPEFFARYGPWALVAGASEGIGAEFARQLAEHGLSLVLLARRKGPLEALADEIRARHGIEVRCVAIDLGSPDLLETVRQGIEGIEVGLLVYNAAVSRIGGFLDSSLEEQFAILDVNCRGPVTLAWELGRRMAERGRGGLILMSSIAGNQGSPLIATYAASKAFNTVFGESLWGELQRQGIDALAFLAGATRTPSFESSNARTQGSWPPVMEPGPVAREALAALGRRPSAVAGRSNRFASFVLSHLLSRKRAVRTMTRQMFSMYGN